MNIMKILLTVMSLAFSFVPGAKVCLIFFFLMNDVLKIRQETPNGAADAKPSVTKLEASLQFLAVPESYTSQSGIT